MAGKKKAWLRIGGAPWWRFVSYQIGRAFIWLFAKLYNRIERRGAKLLGLKGPLVFVSNHASNLDPIYVGCIIPPMIHNLAKKELFKVPFVGQWIWLVGAMPVDRESADSGALRRAVDLVKNGGRLLLFPEGTRTRDGSLGPGLPGVGMIASMSRARVVPVYIDGTFEAMPRGVSGIRPHKVVVNCGEPFELPKRSKGMAGKEYYQLCADEMMKRIAALRDDGLEGSAPAEQGKIESGQSPTEDGRS